MMMMKKISATVAAITLLGSVSAYAAFPAGYPADYQKLVDGAKKEGKVVIYSTTDTKAAAPLIQGVRGVVSGHQGRIQRHEQHRTV
ncbi:Uncharacterised protein [Serratia marcescens]|uniref:Uncharacterized protein n=1 Tax=Serratia marcescens TaxID=615 RepID=A0A379YKQ8_SERMA|nr:Uncharacterised protein [Serratia marcescens]